MCVLKCLKMLLKVLLVDDVFVLMDVLFVGMIEGICDYVIFELFYLLGLCFVELIGFDVMYM